MTTASKKTTAKRASSKASNGVSLAAITAPAEIVKTGVVLPDLTQVPQEAPANETPAVIRPTDAELRAAGQGMAVAEQNARDVIVRIGATKEEQDNARKQIIVGYLIGKAHGNAPETQEMVDAALVIYNAKGCNAKTLKAGEVKRSDDEDRDYRTAMKRWERACDKAGVEIVGKSGGHNKGETGARKEEQAAATPAAPAPVAVPMGRVLDIGTHQLAVHSLKEAFMGLMLDGDMVAPALGDDRKAILAMLNAYEMKLQGMKG